MSVSLRENTNVGRCKARNVMHCHKLGHFNPIRKSKSKNVNKVINNITTTQYTIEMTPLFQTWSLTGSRVKIPKVSNNVQVRPSRNQLTMRVASGAEINIISEAKYKQFASPPTLTSSNAKLKSNSYPSPPPSKVTHIEYSEVKKHLTPLSSKETFVTRLKAKTKEQKIQCITEKH